jgi:hypothetical protein
MKKLTIALLVLILFGCGEADKVGTAFSGNYKFERICIDGVEYLHYNWGYQSGLSPHFKPDGSLYTCNNRVESKICGGTL